LTAYRLTRLEWHAGPIRTRGAQCVAHVGGAEHARQHRQLAAVETEVVAAAIEPLVMRRGGAGEMPEAAGAHEDLARGYRMTPHDLELAVGERRRFVED